MRHTIVRAHDEQLHLAAGEGWTVCGESVTEIVAGGFDPDKPKGMNICPRCLESVRRIAPPSKASDWLFVPATKGWTWH